MRHITFTLQMDLRVTGYTRSMVCRQAQRLVKRVGMQRLRMTSDGSAGFNTGPRHVIEDILRRQ